MNENNEKFSSYAYDRIKNGLVNMIEGYRQEFVADGKCENDLFISSVLSSFSFFIATFIFDGSMNDNDINDILDLVKKYSKAECLALETVKNMRGIISDNRNLLE